jgi:predicted RNase H-like HicB family nuclease
VKVLGYEIEMVAEPEGGFTVLVPELPGCVTVGETEEEALAMVAEAIELWLEVDREKGGTI